jgi:3',5'-cyclic AMP phosphodiesterase CpdA
MKKIIHLSDLHMGAGDSLGRPAEVVVTRLLEQFGDCASEYVVVVTGDLVQRATPCELDDYMEAKSQLDRFEDAGFDLVLAPGNHDLGTGSIGFPDMVPIFEETFYGDVRGFPRLSRKGDIAFVILNSLAEELHWFDRWCAQGQIGKAQLDRMVTMLLSPASRACSKRVLCLHHHPFDWLPLHRLKDGRRLEKMLCREVINAENGVSVDAILYGHNHRGRSECGECCVPRAYDAGSATLKRSTTSRAPVCCIREIDLGDPNPANDDTVPMPTVSDRHI